MKISLKGQFGSLVGPMETTDRAFADDVGRIMHGIRNSLGTLSDDDIASITSILQKYVGVSGITNRLATTSASDAAEARRRAAAVVRANIKNNQSVASGYSRFWNARNEELRGSIRR